VKLRVTFPIAAAALFLTACHASTGSNTMLPASPSSMHASASRGQAYIKLTLPVIVPAHPDPIPGLAPTRLSSATHSLAGTFGSFKLTPIVLTMQTPGCTARSDGLHCTVALPVPAGNALLTASTFASSDGTGTSLATASQKIDVKAGRRTNATPAWVAIAATYKLAFTKRVFSQGIPASTVISFYAIDAAGAIVPSNVVEGHAGGVVQARLRLSGDYPQTIALPGNAPFTTAPFAYSGRLSGSTTVSALPIGSAAARSAYASGTLLYRSGASGSGQLFIFGDGDGYGSRLIEWAAGASGTDAPLRTYALAAGPVWANAAGDFWAGPFGSGAKTWMEKYDAAGRGLVRITPVRGAYIVAGAVDRSENVYVAVQSLGASPQGCTVYVYSAKYVWKSQRSFYAGYSCPAAIAADTHGNVYLASLDDGDTIAEYGPTASGPEAQPIRTLAIPPDEVVGLAIDSTGTVYLQSYATLLKYPAGSSTAQQALPGVVIGRFALDPHDNVYVSSYGIVYEYAPGETAAMRTVSLFGSGDGLVEAIAAGP
jgi:hypothetical protein